MLASLKKKKIKSDIPSAQSGQIIQHDPQLDYMFYYVACFLRVPPLKHRAMLVFLFFFLSYTEDRQKENEKVERKKQGGKNKKMG